MTTSQHDRVSIAITLVVVAIVVFLGFQVAAVATSDDIKEYTENASAYCGQELGENATLVNSHVIGEHGGLHCEGPSGEFIHLHDVPRGEIDDAAAEVGGG